MHVVGILGNHWSVGDVAFVTAVRWDEDIEPARYDEAPEEDEQDDMTNAKAQDVQGVGFAVKRIRGADELWVREGIYDGQDGSGDVLDQRAPDHRDVPVLAGADDDVQVAAELLTLWYG